MSRRKGWAFWGLVGALVGFTCALGYSAGQCALWSDATYGYSLCLPKGWYNRQLPSGALFLCDDPKGACTTAVGGGPRLGHAIISVLPVEVVLDERPTTLEHFAHVTADVDSSSEFSDTVSLPGDFGPVKYIVVSQTFTSGGRNEIPQKVYRYFAEADHKMVELILSFNTGDRRGETYRNAAEGIIKSLHAK